MSQAERKGFWVGVLAGVFGWTMVGMAVGVWWGWSSVVDADRRESQWSIAQREMATKFIQVGEKCAAKDTVDACLRHCAEGFDDVDSTNWCTAGVMGEAYK